MVFRGKETFFGSQSLSVIDRLARVLLSPERACAGCPFPGLPAAEVTGPRHKEQRREEWMGSCQVGEEVTPTGPGLERQGPRTHTRGQGPASLL